LFLACFLSSAEDGGWCKEQDLTPALQPSASDGAARNKI
jgi:hypothetical protein